MKLYKRIVSLFLVIAMSFVFSASSFATGSSSVVKGSYWDFYGMNMASQADALGPWAFLARKLGSMVSENVCANSPDHLHHGEVIKVLGASRGGFVTAKCKCEHCTSEFTVKVTPDQLNTAYTDYVTALPADNINKAGLSDFYITGWTYKFPAVGPSLQKVVSQRSDALAFEFVSGSSTSSFEIPVHSGVFTVPADGEYRFVIPKCVYSNGYGVGQLGLYSLVDGKYSYVPFKKCFASSDPPSASGGRSLFIACAGDPEYYYADFLLSKSISYCFSSFNNYDKQAPFFTRGLSFYFNMAYKTCNMYVKPHLQGLDLASSAPVGSYSNDTRTGSLSGNFGYTGPDGTMITAENIKIVNETTNTLFNPVTNTTINFKDWTYDYSTRTYNVTLDTGTKQTITYGDENVTIKEGDTIYNIYYVTPDTPPTPPVTCKHDYIPAVTTAATCIAPGVKTYTCSKCKDSYIEKIPATGHSWIVKETVKTTYDATGAPLTQGYTIWKCSVCGEEYKDASGAGPPGGGSSGGEVTTKEGFLSKLWGILLSFAVGLSSLFNFLFGAEGQSNLDFYTKPSTFSGVDIWV